MLFPKPTNFFSSLVFFGLVVAGCAPSTQPGSPHAQDPFAPRDDSRAQTHPSNVSNPGDTDTASPADRWNTVARLLERPGVEHYGVYTVTVPRDDWNLAIEGMGVPAAAGVGSVLNFYVCPCGKTIVIGQICVADYELNDVIDALRAGRIEVASVAPMLLHTRPQPLLVRFQAEGNAADLAKALREAIHWTGKERMAAEPGVFGK
jgi:hypothetical protein